jgi:O-antigen/teichoic acid export membrane protein
MPVLVGMALVADDGFAVVLGEKWQAAVLPFRLLTVAGVTMVVATTLAPLFNAVGRPDLSLKYTAVCAAVFPALFYLLGSKYGLVGVCLGWMLYPVVVGALVSMTRGVTGVGLGDLLRVLASVFAAIGVMAAVVLSAAWCLSGLSSAALRLIVLISLGAITYAAAIWILARNTVLADVRTLWRELRGATPASTVDVSKDLTIPHLSPAVQPN